MKLRNCVLISGTMRSGTTLMATALNNHSQLALATDVLTWFWKKAYRGFGDISDELMLDKFLYEIQPTCDYYGTRFDPEEVKRNVLTMGISYKSIHQALILQQVMRKDAFLLGEKSTHTAEWYENFLQEYPSGYIIHMLRDPRDVMVSLRLMHSVRKAPLWGGSTCKNLLRKIIPYLVEYSGLVLHQERAYFQKYPDRIIDYWRKTAIIASALHKASPQNIMIVKYEDFVSNPVEILGQIINWMDLDNETQVMDYAAFRDRKGGTWKANTSHRNSKLTGFSTNQIGKFENYLSVKESDNILEKAGSIAADFGYSG